MRFDDPASRASTPTTPSTAAATTSFDRAVRCGRHAVSAGPGHSSGWVGRCSGLGVLLLLLVIGSAPRAHAEEAEPTREEQVKALVAQMKSKDVDERRTAAEKALDNPDKKLTSPLVKLLGDSHSEVRVAAIEALGTRSDTSSQRKAASNLASRLKRYMDKGEYVAERDAAIASLRQLAQPTTIKKLIDSVDLETDPEVVADILMAVANVPSDDAIERLIQFLDSGRRAEFRRFKAAAGKALLWATGVKGNGHNPDAWRAWWRGAQKDYDHAAAADRRAVAAAERAEKAARQKEQREKKEARRRERRQGGDKSGKGDGDKQPGDKNKGGGVSDA